MCLHLAELGVNAVRHDLVLPGDITHLDTECVDIRMVCRYVDIAHLLQHPRHHLRLGGGVLVLAAGPRAVLGNQPPQPPGVLSLHLCNYRVSQKKLGSQKVCILL